LLLAAPCAGVKWDVVKPGRIRLAKEQLNSVLATLKPLQDELTKHGAIAGQSLQELVARLRHVDELEAQISELQQENAVLLTQVSLIKQLGVGDTGSTSKARYKQLRSVVEQNFYPFFPPSQRAGTPALRQNSQAEGRLGAQPMSREAAAPPQGSPVNLFPWTR
jgi:hypothetical protein